MDKGLLLYKTVAIQQLVLIRVRVHPFPSRTRKLSSLLPTILGWRRPGKIGSANTERSHSIEWLLFLYSYCGSAIHCSKSATIRYNTPISLDRGIVTHRKTVLPPPHAGPSVHRAAKCWQKRKVPVSSWKRVLCRIVAFFSVFGKFFLLQALRNSDGHRDGGADHRVVAHAEEAHHLNVRGHRG